MRPMSNGNKFTDEPKPKIFNPATAFTNGGIDMDTTMKLGFQVGKEVLNTTKFSDFFSLQFLKPYFQITNRYVLQKIKYIFFPFLYKKPSNDDIYDQEENEVNEKDKIEYPDLYLPMMSFITYILVIAFNSVTSNNKDLNPDILGIKSTKNLSILLLQAIILKSVFYIFCNVSIPFLDLLSYVSYKLILLIVNVIIWILTGHLYVYYSFFCYTIFISMSFMNKVLQNCVGKENDVRVQQKIVIYSVSCLEICTIILILLDL